MSKDATMEQGGNMKRYYESQADLAREHFNAGEYDKADKICTDLLADSRLPSLWRAQSNFILATTKQNTALEYARAAVKWYSICLDKDSEDDYLKKMLHKSQLLVNAEEARERATAASQQAAGETTGHGEVGNKSPDVEGGGQIEDEGTYETGDLGADGGEGDDGERGYENI
ncbi:uncharacterized protein AB675_1911 [Cyphellophora attinorum]|uniref:Uncharacterized protein n=1 Tax=Cyphellophora attinorum TaxID=1664694 RepID=A0A0N1HE25_9EURO|nr:uncharacterized protein AB675_1911 [Phialophora attinorum]KPI43082.1 hypothetical protein AB675_1911 [Phialophora attinorum]